jgi:hypothetical protein
MSARMGTLLLVLLAATCVRAAERVHDFAYGSQLDVDGSQALYEVTLPTEVYEGTARADLGDVRVFNAGGEVVPYAWQPRKSVQRLTVPPLALTLFPLKAAGGTAVEGLAITVRRSAGGAATVSVSTARGADPSTLRTVGYLIDLSTVDRALHALILEWSSAGSGFSERMNVDASDDLATWRNLVAGAPLLALEVGGQRLDQKRIELPVAKARYLRLSWIARDSSQDAPQLTSARGELADMDVDVARVWKQFEVRGADKAGEYAFDLRARYPVDRVRLQLPEANTIVQVELLVREKPEDVWRPISRGIVYRLRQNGQEITSPDLSVGRTTDRYWLVRVDQRGGGIGAGALQLSTGWVPDRLVFSARGGAPFQLVYGNRDAAAGAYPIDALIPGYKEGHASPVKLAKADAAPLVSVRNANALPRQQIGGDARLGAAIDWKRWSLWSALVLGVLMLAFMAWRLARQLKATQASPSSDDKGPQV